MKIELWPIAKPVAYARNARKISDAAVDKVAASLKEFGFRQPIVVDAESVIVAGHTRLLAAKKLGLKQVPVHVASELTPSQVKTYRLMDNRSHQESEWDLELLGPELLDLKALDLDLSLTGFNADELDSLMAEKTDGLTDEDDAPAAPEFPVTVPGDLWILGKHRLLCGDSTSVDAVGLLMGSDRADMVFTDPPYGMNYGGGRGKAKFGVIANDAESGAALSVLISGALATALIAKKEGAACYVCFTWRTYDEFWSALVAAGLGPTACIVWDKQRIGLGHGHYRPQHEFIFYVAGSDWRGDRAQSDVWRAARDSNTEYVHPTQKPVELICRAANNSSKAGDTILDLFGGSGSTLIACEKTGRNARLMELDPKYCDVICQRWADFTGKEPIRESDGAAWGSLAGATASVAA